MRRAKIAPRLHEIVDDLNGNPDFLLTDHPVCKAELRALLAVARQADRTLSAEAEACATTRKGLLEYPPHDPIGRLARALARLDRVSREG